MCSSRHRTASEATACPGGHPLGTHAAAAFAMARSAASATHCYARAPSVGCSPVCSEASKFLHAGPRSISPPPRR